MFSFFRRKKKQETPALEEAQVQETAAKVESEVAQIVGNIKEDVESLAESVKGRTESAVETVSGAVEQVKETVAEMPSEAGEAAERVESAKEAVAETVGEAVGQVQEAVATTEEHKLGWAARLKQGLAKSRDKMAKSLAGVFGGGQIGEDLYEELETVLITGDMGMDATEYLMKDVRGRVSLKGLKDGNELRGALKEALYDLIKPLEKPLVLPETKEPFVIMLAGINGAGKTTSIGKLAKYFQAQGKSVLLAAGDTFRAAAREQLQAWGGRNNVTVISQTTGDSAAVCFDAVQAAKARGIDIVLADTAGRLPTQLHLMEEIKKVKRVLQKAIPGAPHEIIVVLDANIGQNAVNQVKAFDDALGLTGLIVTKLDGTAKGGILAALASDRPVPVPVRYIGVGEGIDDLRPFDARAFVDALLD
ncbi:signal recognition particle-docking protein FtsY [Neisseria gonorrhoeae]|uniref:signal recognition particle-docking protein FtsY n=1 Tax=Neisseria gonorrhoeae TaxID=485 RepID=UPI0021E0C559|nr:signal recognition particle-docking protein FtsY [Neisseria gonorrhoeae]MCU9852098.1 signal recognition particle-docking protein FtsY [Neisseria gonorrhoeae]